MTFVEVREKSTARKIKKFSTEKYREQRKRTVELYALPELGRMALQDKGLQDVLRVLTPLWDDRNVTAVKVRERIEKVLAWATVQGHRELLPIRWTVSGAN